MRYKNFSIMKMPGLYFAVLCAIIVACNNQGQTTKDVKDSTNLKGTDTASNPTVLQFPVLYKTKAELDAIFSVGEVRKIVFVFNWDATSQQSTISGFTARPQGQYIDPNAPISLSLTTRSEPITGQFRLENLELTEDMYNDLGVPSAGNPDLIFFPVIGSIAKPPAHGQRPVPACASCLTYKLQWGNHNNLQAFNINPADTDLNPSPPADPGN